MEQGLVAGVVALDRVALPLPPNVAPLHYELGVTLLRQGKAGDAVVELSEAVRLRPRCTEAHSNLGAAYVLRGRLEKGAAQHEKALRLTRPRRRFVDGICPLTEYRLDALAHMVMEPSCGILGAVPMAIPR